MVPESQLSLPGLVAMPWEHVRCPQKPRLEVENSWVSAEEPGAFSEHRRTQLRLLNSYLSGEGDWGGDQVSEGRAWRKEGANRNATSFITPRHTHSHIPLMAVLTIAASKAQSWDGGWRAGTAPRGGLGAASASSSLDLKACLPSPTPACPEAPPRLRSTSFISVTPDPTPRLERNNKYLWNEGRESGDKTWR